jgi:hypothetical protein
VSDGVFQGLGDRDLRIAMLGMVDGNGHPYSWSAIFNGYDRDAMADCPYPAIPDYLAKQSDADFGIPGARITHLWTDDPADAPLVAEAACVPNVAARAEDVIGEVDAVIIATDRGDEHVDRARPFVEAGLPVFIDKPLVDNAPDLAVFREWDCAGKPILSSSSMQYADAYRPYFNGGGNLGELRYASVTTPKTWERYGIHALSAVYPIFGPGFISARNTGTPERNIVHFKHASSADVVVAAISDLYGGMGTLQLVGTKTNAAVDFRDPFGSFKAQLVDYVAFLRTGDRPYPFSETGELMRMVIAGRISRDEGGREVYLEEVE